MTFIGQLAWLDMCHVVPRGASLHLQLACSASGFACGSKCKMKHAAALRFQRATCLLSTLLASHCSCAKLKTLACTLIPPDIYTCSPLPPQCSAAPSLFLPPSISKRCRARRGFGVPGGRLPRAAFKGQRRLRCQLDVSLSLSEGPTLRPDMDESPLERKGGLPVEKFSPEAHN